MNTNKVPQLFVATGATTFNLDFKSNPWTLGWQPPYQGESRIYAKDILANHPNAKIGVLYQSDDYGQDYLKGLVDGLGSNASQIVDKQSFDLATFKDVTAQLVSMKTKQVDTVFVFATPKPAITALVTITKLGWAPTIYLNSVSNPQVYMGLAAKAGAALKNVTSVGYMMVDVLKQAGSNMTRANVMSIAANGLSETNPFLLPGVSVKTSSSDHFPIMQEQVITWGTSDSLWHLQGSLIDERGTVK